MLTPRRACGSQSAQCGAQASSVRRVGTCGSSLASVVRRGRESRRVAAQGRDIYAFTAPLVCEAAERLIGGRFRHPGAQPPGAILDATDVLAALAPDHLAFEMKVA